MEKIKLEKIIPVHCGYGRNNCLGCPFLDYIDWVDSGKIECSYNNVLHYTEDGPTYKD